MTGRLSRLNDGTNMAAPHQHCFPSILSTEKLTRSEDLQRQTEEDRREADHCHKETRAEAEESV